MDQERTLAPVTAIVFITILGSWTSRRKLAFNSWELLQNPKCCKANAPSFFAFLVSQRLSGTLSILLGANKLPQIYFILSFRWILASSGYSVATVSTLRWKGLDAREAWGEAIKEERKRRGVVSTGKGRSRWLKKDVAGSSRSVASATQQSQ